MTVWNRFGAKLISLARKNLDERLRQKEDPEDVVQSASKASIVARRMASSRLDGWGDLWAILVIITVRKCHNRGRRYQTEGRDVSREHRAVEPRHGGRSRDPRSRSHAARSRHAQRPGRAPDEHAPRRAKREILSLALQGCTPSEIAPLVGRTRRTVNRLLARVKGRLIRLETLGDE